MELDLSLGDGGTSKSFGFMEKSHPHGHEVNGSNKGLGFCMGLSIGPIVVRNDANDDHQQRQEEEEEEEEEKLTTTLTPNSNTTTDTDQAKKAADPLKGIQLIDLLPNTPVSVRRNPTPSFLTFPWTSDNGSSEAASACSSRQMAKGFDVNKLPLVEESPELELAGAASSPKSNNSAASSFQVDFCIYSNSTSEGNNNKRDFEIDGETERRLKAALEMPLNFDLQLNSLLPREKNKSRFLGFLKSLLLLLLLRQSKSGVYIVQRSSVVDSSPSSKSHVVDRSPASSAAASSIHHYHFTFSINIRINLSF